MLVIEGLVRWDPIPAPTPGIPVGWYKGGRIGRLGDDEAAAIAVNCCCGGCCV